MSESFSVKTRTALRVMDGKTTLVSASGRKKKLFQSETYISWQVLAVQIRRTVAPDENCNPRMGNLTWLWAEVSAPGRCVWLQLLRALLLLPANCFLGGAGSPQRGEGRGPGGGVPLHAPDRGVPPAQASRHGPGVAPRAGAAHGRPSGAVPGDCPATFGLAGGSACTSKHSGSFPRSGGEVSSAPVCSDGKSLNLLVLPVL